MDQMKFELKDPEAYQIFLREMAEMLKQMRQTQEAYRLIVSELTCYNKTIQRIEDKMDSINRLLVENNEEKIKND